MKPRPKATPTQTRRAGYVVAAFAVFVAASAVYAEVRYADFAARAIALDARVVQVEALRTGKGVRHVLHYAIDLDGTAHTFTDRGGPDTKLDDLYTATFNAFTADDPPLAVGKTFGVLVNPRDASDHVADRAKLQYPELLWLRSGIALLFLAGVSGFLLWAGREPKPARGEASGSWHAPERTRSSTINSSRADGVLRVRAEVDVPWPSQVNAGGSAALHARMQELRAARGPEPSTPVATREPLLALDVEIVLRVHEDAELAEASVELLGPSGAHTWHRLARGVSLRSGTRERIASERVELPRGVVAVRLVLTRSDARAWEHELSL